MINGSVPDLLGSRVECEYGPGVSTSATVHLDSGPAQIQTCPLLPRENYQSILPGSGENERRRPFWMLSHHICRPTAEVTVEASEPHRSQCNFSFHPSAAVLTSACDGDTHLECLTHAMLFTCLWFSRSSGGFCGDKSEWHICGIWELHPLRLREDGSDTPQDIVSPSCFVSDSELYSCLGPDGNAALLPITNVLDSRRFLIGKNEVASSLLWIKPIFQRFCGLKLCFFMFRGFYSDIRGKAFTRQPHYFILN